MPAIAVPEETPAMLEKTAAPIATLDNITKRYGATTALDGLSLSLRPGEVVALLGPNGAGKSTAVRLMLGLASPTNGNVRIFGSDPRNNVTRTRVGAMLQIARVVEALTEDQHDRLTVVSNSVPVINTVTTWNDAHLVAVGGLYLPAYMAFVGPQAVDSLRSLSADVAVMGCDGLSIAEGLTTPHQFVAEIGTILIERARRTIVVADSSKIGRRGFTPIAPATAIDVLVTDEHADEDELSALRQAGIEVHIA